MLSVCIPVYNYDMRATVARLARQAQELTVPCEIVCLDDGSDDTFKLLNKEIATHARYIELKENVGRARIRNLLVEQARYDSLLFLDCDSLIPDGFLAGYAAHLQTMEGVVCGGRIYDAKDNDRRHRLRYRYGVECESKRAAERRLQPYRSFMTNNFMVRRNVIEAIPFDGRISRYGHEDTLFGYHLMRQDIPVVHIENPVVNGDVEENAVFLGKTQEGVRSLWEIARRMEGDAAFAGQVSLLSFYAKVRRLHLAAPVRWTFSLLRRPLEKAFATGRMANMKLFAFYKLGLFATLEKKGEC